MKNEKDVKIAVKKILDDHGWRHWPVPQNGYGVSGVSDRIAVKAGVFMAIESKWKGNKPSELQKKFLLAIRQEGHIAFVVDETTVPTFNDFLTAFNTATEFQMRSEQPPDLVKATLIVTMKILIAPFMEV